MEPPCMAGHSIPIIHINVRKEKIRLEEKYSFASFLCLFPYAHAHDLFFLCVWKENILFSFISYAQAHDLDFFLEQYIVSCLHFPCHRRPLSVPPASRPLHPHPRPPVPTRLPVSAVPATGACFCSSHRRPCPPAPVDLLTTGVPYRFVAIKDNVLHSIRTLCFPGRRHSDIFRARPNIAHYIVIVIRTLLCPWRSPYAPLTCFSLPYH